MQESKLVIVTGMSGTGKSSTSQQLAKQYELNGIPHRWVHEEIDEHPIRKEGEFAVDSHFDQYQGNKIKLLTASLYGQTSWWSNMALISIPFTQAESQFP